MSISKLAHFWFYDKKYGSYHVWKSWAILLHRAEITPIDGKLMSNFGKQNMSKLKNVQSKSSLLWYNTKEKSCLSMIFSFLFSHYTLMSNVAHLHGIRSWEGIVATNVNSPQKMWWKCCCDVVSGNVLLLHLTCPNRNLIMGSAKRRIKSNIVPQQ